MTPQEQDMINGLIDRVQKTQLQEKDADAERLLQQGLSRTPDSLYILSQTVLVQQYALDQAQQQLAALKKQVDQLQSQQQHPKPATSFLGGLFGGGSSDRPAPPSPPSPQQSGQYAPVPAYPSQSSYGQPAQNVAPAYGNPQYGVAPQQGGGFLRGAAQTAAGVAAGALAFEGVESLLHGFGNSMTGMGGGGGRPEEIVNNYYGDDARDHGNRGDNFTGDDQSRDNNDPGSNAFTDDDRNNFAASGDDAGADSNDSGDDNAFDGGGDSDDSSFDDGGDSTSDDSSADDSY